MAKYLVLMGAKASLTATHSTLQDRTQHEHTWNITVWAKHTQNYFVSVTTLEDTLRALLQPVQGAYLNMLISSGLGEDLASHLFHRLLEYFPVVRVDVEREDRWLATYTQRAWWRR